MGDLTKLKLVPNGAKALTFSNGAATQDIVGGVDERTLLIVKNTDAQTARVWVRKGDGIRAAADFYVDVAQNGYSVIGPLESSIYKDVTTGKIKVDITDDDDADDPSEFAGTITNVKLAVVYIP
jgi:hypothetical protein